MVGALSLLLKWWAFCSAAVIGLFVAGHVVAFAWRKLRSFVRALRYFGIALLVMFTLYGGSKSVADRFAADDGLEIVRAELFVATNGVDFSVLDVAWTGPDAPQNLWARDRVSSAWRRFPGDGDGWNVLDYRYYIDGTNYVAWLMDPPAATNATVPAMLYLGDDLPPIEILAGDGISILTFGATSHRVTLSYGINPDALGMILNHAVVEVAGPDNAWREMYRATVMPQAPESLTNDVTCTGFWVGKTTRWRVRLEVTQ